MITSACRAVRLASKPRPKRLLRTIMEHGLAARQAEVLIEAGRESLKQNITNSLFISEQQEICLAIVILRLKMYYVCDKPTVKGRNLNCKAFQKFLLNVSLRNLYVCRSDVSI